MTGIYKAYAIILPMCLMVSHYRLYRLQRNGGDLILCTAWAMVAITMFIGLFFDGCAA